MRGEDLRAYLKKKKSLKTEKKRVPLRGFDDLLMCSALLREENMKAKQERLLNKNTLR